MELDIEIILQKDCDEKGFNSYFKWQKFIVNYHSMSNYFFLIVCLMFLYNCQKKDKYAEAREIFNQTTEIHDQVMPMMPELRIIRNSLKVKRNSINNKEIQIQIDSTILFMDQTYNEMMDWMKEFQPVPEKTTPDMNIIDKKISDPDPSEILNIQMKSLLIIKELKNRTEESLIKGKKMLDSN